MKIAKSVIKIAKRDDIDKFVTFEAPLTCSSSDDQVKSLEKIEFNIDRQMYDTYMNVINKAFENEKPSNPELDSKL